MSETPAPTQSASSVYNPKIRKPSAAYIGAVLDAWDEDTGFLSSPTAIAAHPAHDHLASFGMATAAVILQRMQTDKEKLHIGCFSLLGEITGAQPIPHEHAGMVHKMVDHWIAWGYAHAEWAFLPIG